MSEFLATLGITSGPKTSPADRECGRAGPLPDNTGYPSHISAPQDTSSKTSINPNTARASAPRR